MRENVKKSPPAHREHVREALPVQHDVVPVVGHAVQDGGNQEVGDYAAAIMLMTKIREAVVLMMVPPLLSRMVMVGCCSGSS
jgi:hypothetical protein